MPGIAEYIVALAHTEAGGDSHSLSLVLVPTDNPGLKVGPRRKEDWDCTAPHTRRRLWRCRVPLDNLVGEQGLGLKEPWQLSTAVDQHRRDFPGACTGRL